MHLSINMIILKRTIQLSGIFHLPQSYWINAACMHVHRIEVTELKWPAAQSESLGTNCGSEQHTMWKSKGDSTGKSAEGEALEDKIPFFSDPSTHSHAHDAPA